MTAEQKATKAKHTEHIRLTARKVKALPDWAQQRIQGYADGVADATKKRAEKKTA